MKTILIALLAVLTVACATKQDREKLAQNETAIVGQPATLNEPKNANTLAANMVSTVAFKKGTRTLTPATSKKLDAIISEAKSKGEIESIDIAVWSDREYPAANSKLPRTEINLANDRAKYLESYIDKTASEAKITTHNMAKQPSAFAEFFDTKDAVLKQRMEEAGIVPDKGTKTSKAMILIKLK